MVLEPWALLSTFDVIKYQTPGASNFKHLSLKTLRLEYLDYILLLFILMEIITNTIIIVLITTHVAGAWSERKKMFHGGSFLKLADDNMDIQNPEAQNREMSGF